MKTRSHWIKILLYLWVAPITFWWLPLALLAKWTGGGFALHSGVLEIWGGKVGAKLDAGIPFLGAVNALTLGHIVVGISPVHLLRSRVHERTHVAQFERWGLLFPLVYAWAGWRAYRRGKDMYWDNPYEIEARKAAQLAVQQFILPE
jgi:hypothetical protein